MKRKDLRSYNEIRPVKITTDFMSNAHGSCLYECGKTRVLCSCMLQEGVPLFLEGTGTGWLTAEYSMLPASTPKRKVRETLKPDGRSVEIKRLIGRSLRTIIDFDALGENTLYIDCDVISADGGTRTAAINGAFIALSLASNVLLNAGVLAKTPVLDYVSAISAGFVSNKPMVDLCYIEDSNAEADMNLVMTGAGEIIEIQCTGEKRALSFEELSKLLEISQKAIEQIKQIQSATLEGLEIVAKEMK